MNAYQGRQRHISESQRERKLEREDKVKVIKPLPVCQPEGWSTTREAASATTRLTQRHFGDWTRKRAQRTGRYRDSRARLRTALKFRALRLSRYRRTAQYRQKKKLQGDTVKLLMLSAGAA